MRDNRSLTLTLFSCLGSVWSGRRDGSTASASRRSIALEDRRSVALPASALVTGAVLAGVFLGGLGCRPIDATGSCQAGLLSGDLVITELMANPDGSDSGQEWWEIHNVSSIEINLAGMELVNSQADGGSESKHVIGEDVIVPPGGYVVVGAALPEIAASWQSYSYGGDAGEGNLGDLRNGGGRLALRCGETIIDAVTYLEVADGASRIFDGGTAPDASANDDTTRWCDSTVGSADLIGLGSPGAANESCMVAVPGKCLEDGVERDIVPPMAGDIVLSEFMSNPEGTDGGLEWFELYAAASFDLNGLQVGADLTSLDPLITSNECVSASAGDYFLIANDLDTALNGGLPPVDFTFDFALGNSAGSLVVAYGDQALDSMAWDTSLSTSGAAANLDPDFFDPLLADDAANWCASTTPYGGGVQLGTPGSANEECAIAPPDGECLENGRFRPTVPPGPGDLIITEFHANPEVVDDADGEWFELFVNADVDLNGLQLGRDAGAVEQDLVARDCLAVNAGTYVVFAASSDPLVNGGIPEVDHPLEFSLNNTNRGVFVGHGDVVLDAVTYTATAAGAASSLSADSLDVSSNDDEGNWCAAVDPYGDGDLGTPGAANPQCGGGGGNTCLDGGVPRAIVPPTAGQLVITEFMPDSDAVGDADGEWFEVRATADVDLNGVSIRSASQATGQVISSPDCIRLDVGQLALFARSTDPDANGGLPAVDWQFSFGLTNSSGGIVIEHGMDLIDEVSWTSSMAGGATALDIDVQDATSNDDPGNFCAATTPYGLGDLGTPKAANLDCGMMGGADTCLDNGMSRSIVYAAPGDLVIVEAMPDPSAAGDAVGEWFEIYVVNDVDLNGLQLGTLANPDAVVLNSANCLPATAMTSLLFARDADMMVNGGLPDPDGTFSFGLTNTNGNVQISAADATVIDLFSWTTVTGGRAKSVDPMAYDAALNDIAANVCNATSTYGAGDFGTPQALNPSCN